MSQFSNIFENPDSTIPNLLLDNLNLVTPEQLTTRFRELVESDKLTELLDDSLETYRQMIASGHIRISVDDQWKYHHTVMSTGSNDVFGENGILQGLILPLGFFAILKEHEIIDQDEIETFLSDLESVEKLYTVESDYTPFVTTNTLVCPEININGHILTRQDIIEQHSRAS